MLIDNKKKLVELYIDGLIRGNVRNTTNELNRKIVHWIMLRLSNPKSKEMAEATTDIYSHYITRKLRNEIEGELRESDYNEEEFAKKLENSKNVFQAIQ